MRHHRVIALFGVVVLYFVALYVYVPGLPAYAAARTSTLTAVGVALSMYGLWMAVLRVPAGIVTDATGRYKGYLIAGVLLAAIGAIVMAQGRTIFVVGLGRGLTGAAAAAWVPMMVVFTGLFPAERTLFATSLVSLASSLGQMLGTAMTGLVERWGGVPSTFYAAAGVAVAATVILAAVKIPRAPAAHRNQVSARSILAVFRRRDVLVPSFASAFCQLAVWAVVFGFLPLLARRMGASPATTALLMTLNIAANTAANFGATFVARAGDRRPILYGSFGAFAVGAILATLGRTVPLLFVATAIMGLANGVSFPFLVGLAIQRVDASHRSTAMGIHQAVYAVGMFTGPWIGGIVADAVGIQAMFAIVALVCWAASSVLIFINRSAYVGSAAPVRRNASGEL